MKNHGPWRDPPEETSDYPGLFVSDNCVTGSIRVGGRLPVWAFLYTALVDDWDDVEAGWAPTEHYGFTLEKLGSFLGDLFEMRGEFARLLCVLADVERDEQGRVEKALYGHGPWVVDVSPWKADAVRLPEPWWTHDPSRQRVAEQLRRCLATLEDENVAGWRRAMENLREQPDPQP